MSADSTTMEAVRERPILFSGAMVRAILDGRKAQTRRVVQQPKWPGADLSRAWVDDGAVSNPFAPPGEQYLKVPCEDESVQRLYCPYGQPGDRLWVRERHACVAEGFLALKAGVVYHADRAVNWLEGEAPEMKGQTVYNYDRPEVWKWRPSIHMPRSLSRITLEITEVRVERVQDISQRDAVAEGMDWAAPDFLGMAPEPDDFDAAHGCYASPEAGFARDNYARLWDSLNGRRGYGWDVNPWVWVLTFRRVEVPHV